jgi:hypothetical protein
MNKVHYFQRYSQKENVVTNNTLLLFSRLYNDSPIKFSQFLNGLTNGLDINVGINFNQQEKGNGSTPDGAIVQESFKITIETKLSDMFNKSQLLQHLKSFKNESSQILIALSPQLINQSLSNNMVTAIGDYNSEHQTNINFLSTTFENIIIKYKEVINDYNIELTAIINDFEEFCNYEGLIPNNHLRMLTVACGWTLNDNFKYSVYYDPAVRGNSYCTHVGIYKDKRVQGIGKIENIIDAELINDKLIINNTTNGVATTQQQSNIINIINEAKSNLGWNISLGHKFFCVDKFYKTNFIKNTPNGLFGKRYFDLNEYLGLEGEIETSEIAELLKKVDWDKNIV